MSSNNNKQHTKRGADWYRTRRRAESHDAAQAAAESSKAPPIPDHPLIPAGPPQLVTSAAELAELIAYLRTTGSFTYDTEFIGELTYFPRLCLIQVGTTERVALIDPFQVGDLTNFWTLLADEQVEKIVHAGGQDLEPVVRHIDKAPACIFDTQIAAGFAGLGYPTSLTKLVHELLNVPLGAALTYTDWAARPLSAVHQRYAADDVRFGAALKAALAARLEAADTQSYADEECAALSDCERYRPDPQNAFKRIRGAKSLKAGKQQILRALLDARDAAARRQDIPPRALLKDDVLIKMARRPIDTVEALAQMPDLPRPVREEHGQAFVTAIAEAQSMPTAPAQPDYKRDETIAQRVAIDSLFAAAGAYCLGRSIEPVLVATRHEIAAYYRAATNGGPPLQGRLSNGWRKDLLGGFLDEFMQGRQQMRLEWIDGTIRAATQCVQQD
jgi:ribonuclease D